MQATRFIIYAGIGALVAISSACTPTITCEDVGCAYGESCDLSTGRCALITRDCRRDATICRQDQSCDQATGSCLSARVSCVNQQTCPLGQVCNAVAGICQNVGSCGSDRDCEVGQRCDLNSGRCQARACVESRDCGAGLVCALGRCTSGCDAQVPCPAEAICQLRAEQDYGQCILSCTADQDCNFGRYCDFLKTPPVCEPEPPCQDDQGCRADEVCKGGICGRPPCATNAECGSDQVCDTREGLCLGESCQEDAFSPNHSVSTAKALEPGTFVQLSRCPGRPDWFKIPLQSAELLTLEVSHGFNQDLDLMLFDEELVPLAADMRQGPMASLTYQSTRAQMVWIKVDDTSAKQLERTTYSLKATRRTASMCVEDNLEENDTLAQATRLDLKAGDGIGLPLSLCVGDEDWLNIGRLEAKNALSLEVELPEEQQARMTLYTPDGELVELEANEPLNIARVGVEGEYVIRLSAALGRGFGAQLRATARDEYTCPELAFNDAPERAQLIERGALSSHVLCFSKTSWEEDWFELEPEPNQGSRLTLRLARPNPEGRPLSPKALEISLFKARAGGQLDFIRVASPDETGTYGLAAQLEPLANGERWLIKVSATERLARVWSAPLYQLTYRLEPLP